MTSSSTGAYAMKKGSICDASLCSISSSCFSVNPTPALSALPTHPPWREVPLRRLCSVTDRGGSKSRHCRARSAPPRLTPHPEHGQPSPAPRLRPWRRLSGDAERSPSTELQLLSGQHVAEARCSPSRRLLTSPVLGWDAGRSTLALSHHRLYAVGATC